VQCNTWLRLLLFVKYIDLAKLKSGAPGPCCLRPD